MAKALPKINDIEKTPMKEVLGDDAAPKKRRGRPKKRDPYPKSPYGMKHPLHPLNIQKRKEKESKKSAAAKK